MKKKLIAGVALVMMVAIAASLGGCIEVNRVVGSPDIGTKYYDFQDFKQVEVSNAFEVEIDRADTYQVNVTLNENLFEHLDISVSGDTLRIRMKPYVSFIHTTQKAAISMPDLRNLKLSGATRGTVTGFHEIGAVGLTVSGASHLVINDFITEDSAQINVSGASRITGSMETIDGNFEISGASSLDLTGSGSDVSLDVSGASRARLTKFYMVDAAVNVSGASEANVEVSGRLDLNVSGASRLTYGGDPGLGRVEVSGASTLSRQ